MGDRGHLKNVADILGIAGSITTLLSLAALSSLIAYLLARHWLARKNIAVEQAIAQKDNEALARLLGGTSVPDLQGLSARQKLTLATEELRTRSKQRIIGYALTFFAFLAFLGFILTLVFYDGTPVSDETSENNIIATDNEVNEVVHQEIQAPPLKKPRAMPGDDRGPQVRQKASILKSEPQEEPLVAAESSPLNIAGRWIDQDGAEWRIIQVKQYISFKVFKNGEQIGNGKGSIYNRIIHQTYWSKDEQMECPADLQPGGNVIDGVCEPSSGTRAFRLTRTST